MHRALILGATPADAAAHALATLPPHSDATRPRAATIARRPGARAEAGAEPGEGPPDIGGDAQVRHNKRIDTSLSSVLFALPDSVVALPDPRANPASLAQRNLLRHLTFSLPSGQRVARAMRLPALSRGDLAMLKPHGMDDHTPLWFYVLREAAVVENGERLGPVGARIVAEVFIGLLEGDRASYLSQDPDWEPFLPTLDPAGTGEDFRMADLLRFAGVA